MLAPSAVSSVETAATMPGVSSQERERVYPSDMMQGLHRKPVGRERSRPVASGRR